MNTYKLKRFIFESSSYSFYIFNIYLMFKRGDIYIFFFIFEENIYGFRRIQSQFVCFKPIFYFRELKISKSYKSCKLFEESCIVVSSAKRIVKNFDDLGRSFIYSMKRLCTRVLAMIKMSDLQPYTLKTFVWSIIH